MTGLREALAGYLAVRRSLGYKLDRPEKLLGQFISWAEDAGAATVTTEHALAWATLPGGDPYWHACRLSVVRAFATCLHTIDPAARVPPAGMIPARPHRATPYLYSSADITALIAAAASLRFPLRVATYQTLIGLLTVTGMRVGEAISLNRADLDLAEGVVTVRQAKFGKTRLLPLHPTAVTALGSYLRLRDQLHPAPTTPAVFISPAGTRLLYCNVHATWKLLAAQAGLQPRSASCRPASTICVIPSPSAACSMPMPPGRTAKPGWPCYLPTWIRRPLSDPARRVKRGWTWSRFAGASHRARCRPGRRAGSPARCVAGASPRGLAAGRRRPSVPHQSVSIQWLRRRASRARMSGSRNVLVSSALPSYAAMRLTARSWASRRPSARNCSSAHSMGTRISSASAKSGLPGRLSSSEQRLPCGHPYSAMTSR
jgi:site-specific recombinase XerD